jgi:DNA-binding CsgD family transcriptional regulator
LELAEESLPIWRTLHDPLGLVQALILSGVAAYRVAGHFQDAEARLNEALAVLSHLDAPEWVPNARAYVTCELGQLAMRQGDVARAESYFTAVRDSEASDGFGAGESYIYGTVMLLGLADLARLHGDAATALGLYQRSLASGRRYRNVRGTCQGLAGVAASLAALGSHTEAACFFGACEALNDALGFDFWREVFNRQRALGLPEPWLGADTSFGDFQGLRTALIDTPPLAPIRDPEALADVWAEGRTLPLAVVVSKALAAEPSALPSAGAEAPGGLSSREIDVLRLLVDGHTDNAIAGELFISPRTTATHVRHIYDKLGVSSRAEAAAWAVRNGIA